ncbi:MAG: hypothetical protein U0232_24145 [Thermomicrobiales bacterium]
MIVVDGKGVAAEAGEPVEPWVFDVPGGRMEGGEEIEETLVAESREELPSIGRIEVGS